MASLESNSQMQLRTSLYTGNKLLGKCFSQASQQNGKKRYSHDQY